MHIVIIGNGISGITAARHLRKRMDCRLTVIGDETKYHFARTALMYAFMGHIPEAGLFPYENCFWEKNRIDLLQDRVVGIDSEHKCLRLSSGSELGYDKLILATGSRSRTLGIANEGAEGVQGLYSWQDWKSIEAQVGGMGQAAVIGGGLTGVELAEMLHSRGVAVRYFIRDAAFWGNQLPAEEAEIITAHLRKQEITLYLDTSVLAFEADEENRLKALITDKGERYPLDFAGVCIGVKPNVHFPEGSPFAEGLAIDVDEHFRTSVPDIYAIGDCAALTHLHKGWRATEATWYAGRMQGEALAKHLSGEVESFTPGVHFNSAKFFHIVYHAYGEDLHRANSELKTVFAALPHKDMSLRLGFDAFTGQLRGIVALGLGLRQSVCSQWIEEGWTYPQVREQLQAASFSPRLPKELIKQF